MKSKETLYNELAKRLDQSDLNNNAQRGELNFWQGNVSTMRRDLDMQMQFNQQLADENKTLRQDVESLRTHLTMKDREQNLLTKQIRSLHEDNERIVAMYKMIQQTPPKGTKCADEEVNGAPLYVNDYAQTKKKDQRAHVAKKGWETVKDDFGGASFGKGSPASAASKDLDQPNEY